MGEAPSDEVLVDITPPPILAGLHRLDDRMPDGVSVSTRVPARRRVAATDVSARQAQPPMHPRGAEAKTFSAAPRGTGHTGPDRGYSWVALGRTHEFAYATPFYASR